jgi:hypothetical protein
MTAELSGEELDELAAEIETSWLMDVCLDLGPGMRVRVSRIDGMAPAVKVTMDRCRFLAGFAVGNVEDLDAVHVGLAEAMAVAWRQVADEVCEIVATRIEASRP